MTSFSSPVSPRFSRPNPFVLFPPPVNSRAVFATQLRPQLQSPLALPHTFRHHGVRVPRSSMYSEGQSTHSTAFRVPANSLISFIFILFRTLSSPQKPYLPSFHANPNSLRRTPGVGTPSVQDSYSFNQTSLRKGSRALFRPQRIRGRGTLLSRSLLLPTRHVFPHGAPMKLTLLLFRPTPCKQYPVAFLTVTQAVQNGGEECASMRVCC